jgi:hypothetical protein
MIVENHMDLWFTTIKRWDGTGCTYECYEHESQHPDGSVKLCDWSFKMTFDFGMNVYFEDEIQFSSARQVEALGKLALICEEDAKKTLWSGTQIKENGQRQIDGSYK